MMHDSLAIPSARLLTRVSRWCGLSGLFLAMVIGLAGCQSAGPPESPQRAAIPQLPLPPMKTFGPGHGTPAQRGNAQMAQDFLDLAFRMESGRQVPTLTRFEGPVRLALTGDVPATAARDADRLVQRLRAEAGIPISRITDPASAEIVVEFIPRRVLQRAVPQAACFVVPRVANWEEYLRSRHGDRLDWTTLTVRQKATVFIPSDTPPQEVRDCLHEEVAQALGPLNDLYRLPDSVFNDDNFHTVLTGFDMLMLRTYYSPDLANGMSRQEVAARLPTILDRYNPVGRGGGGGAVPDDTPRAWIDAIETAIGSSASESTRMAAAQHALAISKAQGWQDSRAAFSHFTLARLTLSRDVRTALISLLTAGQLYRSLPGAEIHACHVDMQLAAFTLSTGAAKEALALIDRCLPDVAKAENAALLSTLLMMKSEALTALGHPGEAAAARLDSLGWARYGFGSDEQVWARMSEIAALAPVMPVTAKGGRGS